MKKWLTLAVAFVMLFGLMSVAGAQTQFGLEPMESRQTLRVGYFAGSAHAAPFYIAECGGAHSMSQRGVYGKERDNAG